MKHKIEWECSVNVKFDGNDVSFYQLDDKIQKQILGYISDGGVYCSDTIEVEDVPIENKEETLTIWCRVSGTMEVPVRLVKKMLAENVEWLKELDNLPFTRDYSDDYVPKECIPAV